MELIEVLVSRRLQREMRRREAALQEAARAPEAADSEPQPLVARYASTTQGWWECDFCRRGFHGYGQFLNHDCHQHE